MTNTREIFDRMAQEAGADLTVEQAGGIRIVASIGAGKPSGRYVYDARTANGGRSYLVVRSDASGFARALLCVEGDDARERAIDNMIALYRARASGRPSRLER